MKPRKQKVKSPSRARLLQFFKAGDKVQLSYNEKPSGVEFRILRDNWPLYLLEPVHMTIENPFGFGGKPQIINNGPVWVSAERGVHLVDNGGVSNE